MRISSNLRAITARRDHSSITTLFQFFFFKVLHPPISSPLPNKVEKYYDLGDLRVGRGADEVIFKTLFHDLDLLFFVCAHAYAHTCWHTSRLEYKGVSTAHPNPFMSARLGGSCCWFSCYCIICFGGRAVVDWMAGNWSIWLIPLICLQLIQFMLMLDRLVMEMLIWKIGMACWQSLLYEIIANLRAAGNNAANSSSAPPGIPLQARSLRITTCFIAIFSFSKLFNLCLFSICQRSIF